MLDVLNRFAHGYVLTPILKLFQQRNVLGFCSQNGLTITQIAKELSANEGHFRVALRMLQSLGLLHIDKLDCLQWVQNDGHQQAIIADAAIELYRLDSPDLLLSQGSVNLLSSLVSCSQKNTKHYSQQWCDILDAPLAVTLLLLLRTKQPEELFHTIDEPMQTLVREFFIHKGWLTATVGNREIPALTDLGRFLLERSLNLGVTASYRPMLRQIEQVIFGDPSLVFTRDAEGHESHIDRTLNVLGSGFQHEKYFLTIDTIIEEIFNQPQVSDQPKYIVDMGCGDGTLLKRIYDLIKSKTNRGIRLNQFPVIMVGVDFNEKSLLATQKKLENIPHLVLQGDVADPKQMIENLQKHGINDLDQCLHIRSFLDHEIPYQDPVTCFEGDFQSTAVYVDASGKSILPANMYQRYVEHFIRWASITSRHGLIVLEVHSPSAQILAQYIDDSESIHFDALQAFSGQNLLTADQFLSAAAQAGLFVDKDYFKRFPHTFPFTRITLNWFHHRDYYIRPARIDDLPELLELESVCWSTELRVDAELLRTRVQQQGSVVIIYQNKVAGVVYTQRIADAEVLMSTNYSALAALHHPEHPLLQLITLNVLPSMQHLALGDALLSFILDQASLKEDIQGVVGVTRCKNYLAHSAKHSYDEYVSQAYDPILLFHTSHGAKIRRIVNNFRPQDQDNLGHGILIEYPINHNWLRAIPQKIKEQVNFSKNYIEQVVQGAIQYQLKHHKNAVYSAHSAFKDLGLDSLDLTELRNVLNNKFALSLEASIFFRYSTPEKLIQYLESRIAKPSEEQQDIQEERLISLQDDMRGRNDIAIVGIGCRFPGGIDDAQSFWQALLTGKNVIQPVSDERWPQSITSADVGANYGGFIENVKCFDAEFFGISPREAQYIDPQQRLLLETAWHALEHAGIQPQSLRGSNTGVFVGLFSHDYEWLQLKDNQPEDYQTYFSTGNAASVAAGRVAYVFDFQGPALTVDTACSSSLMAIHLACQSIKQGECDIALAGGVNLILSPELSLTFARSGMLAEDGQCKVFDNRADGYVRSEGCAVVVLKSLQQALANQDRILAVIKSTTVNQDGASNGLTAPNGQAQEQLIRKGLAAASVNPEEILYHEAHGTGTKLGDPVEMQAIANVFSSGKERATPLFIGSVKTNLGHTEAASGIAGLIKAILTLQHAYVPKHLHLQTINPLVESELARIPATISRDGHHLSRKADKPFYAAISSFGFSGTNVHAVIESPPIQDNATPQHPISLYPFKRVEHWLPFTANPKEPRHAECSSMPLMQLQWVAQPLERQTEKDISYYTIQLDQDNAFQSLPLSTDPLTVVCYASKKEHQHDYFAIEQTTHQYVENLLTLVRWIRDRPLRLMLISEGDHLAFACLSGFLRVLELEYPTVITSCITIDSLNDLRLDELIQHELGQQTNLQVAYRQQQRFVLQQRPWQPSAKPIVVKSHASYAITGGLGALGLQAAKTLVELGATNLILISRRGDLHPEQQSLFDKLQAKATIKILRVDVTNAQQLEFDLQQALHTFPPLSGVIHAAGLIDDALLSNQNWSRIEPVLRVKAQGAWNMHQITREQPLDFFIMYSSVSATLGIIGQANYALANAWLNAFVHVREEQGLVATSIHWGPWRGLGMASHVHEQLKHQHGLLPIEQTEGHQVLKQILTLGAGNIVAAHIRSDLPTEVVNIIRRVLKLPTDQNISREQSLKDLGIDSLLAIEIAQRLSDFLGKPLPVGIVYDYPTPSALINFAVQQTQQPLLTKVDKQEAVIDANEPIAIIGYGCRLPGNSNNPQEFWQLLTSGKNGVVDLENHRWVMDDYFSTDPDAAGKMYCRQAGLMDNIEKFDAEFFGISPHEAESMDPQQRILLEVTWQTLESAGYVANPVEPENAGVFIGIMSSEYGHRQFTANAADITAHMSTGSALSVAAGRISYFLGWQGPALAIDTACSSSLVAIHTACQSLRQQECKIALAGGINILLTPELSVALSRARMLAPDGNCKTFAEEANGYVRSEGCGLVLLKPLHNALADNDNIVGVIKGSAINQDGRSQGLTAPNGNAQKAVIQRALKTSAVKADEVSYVEAHGTGTALGDPIEVNALIETYRADSAEHLTLGAVKSNIGHCETAAGVAGLIKILLMFQHQQIPANLHLHQLSSRLLIPQDKSILFAENTKEWSRGTSPRIAALSSFGFSGTNAHMIIVEPPLPLPIQRKDVSQHLLTLSARNPKALQQVITDMIYYLLKDDSANLVDICFTTTCGRTHFAYRLALICNDKSDAIAQLKTSGLDFRSAEHLNPKAIILSDLKQAATYYMQGGSIDGNTYYQALNAKKVFLPTYPFQGQSHWSIRPAPTLNRKLQIAGLSTTVYEQTLTPWYPFHLADHQLFQTTVIPGAAHIVLAMQSFIETDGRGSGNLELSDISFAKPCIIESTTEYVLQHAVTKKQGHDYQVQGHSSTTAQAEWLLHYQLNIKRMVRNQSSYDEGLTTIQSRLLARQDQASYYQTLVNVGYHLSNSFRLIEEIWYSEQESLARLRWEATDGTVPPGLLDACFQTTLIAAPSMGILVGNGSEIIVPFAIDKLMVYSLSGKQFWCHSKRRELDSKIDSSFAIHDITLLDDEQNIVIQIIGLTTKRVLKQQLLQQTISSDFYIINWQPKPVEKNNKDIKGTWLLYAEQQGIAMCLAQQMEAQGARCLFIDKKDPWSIQPSDEISGVIYLCPIDFPAQVDSDNSISELANLLHLIQALVRLNIPPKIFLVTQFAEYISSGDAPISPLQTSVWGFGKVLAQEHPEFQPVLVDLDKQEPTTLAEHLFAIIQQPNDEENQWAVRGSRTLVARLQKLHEQPVPRSDLQINANGTYFVTGGLGGIARVFIEDLVAKGSQSIALLIHRPANEAEQDYLLQLRNKGINLSVFVGDVADASKMSDIMSTIIKTLAPLKGVIHTAGIIRDGMIVKQSLSDFMAVMPAKIIGTMLLYKLTQGLVLDFFVVFSSAASLLGSIGQANYAAANSYLDAMAHLARQEGRMLTSINWGSWAQIGMTSLLKKAYERHQVSITPTQGLQAFAQAVANQNPQQAFIVGGLGALKAIYGHDGRHRLLDELTEVVEIADHPWDFLTKLREMPPLDRQMLLREKITATILATMKLPADTVIADHENLQNVGLDSLLAVDLRNKLAKLIAKTLPVTLLYDYPTLSLLCDAISRTLGFNEKVLDDGHELTTKSSINEMDELAIELALQAHINELLPTGEQYE